MPNLPPIDLDRYPRQTPSFMEGRCHAFWQLPVAGQHFSYDIPRDQKDEHGRTPLYHAVKSQDLERARAYLDHGAQPTSTDRIGWSILAVAVNLATSDDDPMVALLLERGARVVEPHDLALVNAVRANHRRTVQRLLAVGADLNAQDPMGTSALVVAVQNGHRSMVHWLLDQGVNPNVTVDTPDVSPLSTALGLCLNLAIVGGRNNYQQARKTAVLLLEAGANPNTVVPGFPKKTCATPVLLAIALNDLPMLQSMADTTYGIDVEQRALGISVLGAVLMPAVKAFSDEAREPLFDWVMNVLKPSTAGFVYHDDTALHAALFGSNDGPTQARKIRALLDAGLDVMAPTTEGTLSTLFMAHAFKDKPSSRALRDPALLQQWAAAPTFDVHALDADGMTLLHRLTTEKGRVDHAGQAARWLIEHGADVNKVDGDGWTPLSRLVGSNGRASMMNDAYTVLLNTLLDQPNVDWQAGRQPDVGHVSHMAVKRLMVEHFQRLIEAGMPVNDRNQEGHTPLHIAAAFGLKDIARVLLDAGSDVHAPNGQGRRPHEEAFFHQHHRLGYEILHRLEDGLLRTTVQAMDPDAVVKPRPRL